MSDETHQKLQIDWFKTAGGALAAVSSAVLLSTLGAAGTIIGAALGSVVVTVGGALYSQGLARSQQRLAQAQTAALRKVGLAQAEVRRAEARRAERDGEPASTAAHLARADDRLEEARDDLDVDTAEAAESGWRQRLVLLPWKRIALGAAGLFAAAILAITAFELVAGESVSSITGGSDGGSGPTLGLGGGSKDDTSQDDEVPATDRPSPSGATSQDPSTEPSPTDEVSGEPSGSTTPEPEPSTTPTPSSTPSTPAPTLPTETATDTPPG